MVEMEVEVVEVEVEVVKRVRRPMCYRWRRLHPRWVRWERRVVVVVVVPLYYPRLGRWAGVT